MEKLCVYNEQVVRMNGIETRIGDDTLPYVGSSGLLVADGLGGGAGKRIGGFQEACFDPDALPQTLFGGLFPAGEADPGWQEPEFLHYVQTAFSSLTNDAMRAVYAAPEQHASRMKKSAFFGSHVLGALAVHYLNNMQPAELDALFDRAQQGQAERKAMADALRDQLLEQTAQALEAGGLHYGESSFGKLSHFGTTFTLVLYREREDAVDALFFSTGDSRALVWDADGLRQAVDDLGRRGSMISCFQLNDTEKVEFWCECRTYKKPCALLAMTDGVYGTPYFHPTPLLLEGYLMSVLSESGDLQQARETLEGFFRDFGKHDDSNSMAAAFFGFADGEAIRSAAAARLAQINALYGLNELPEEFLNEDYAALLAQKRAEALRGMTELAGRIYAQPGVQALCNEQLLSGALGRGHRAPLEALQRSREELLAQAAEAEALAAQKLSELAAVVQENRPTFEPEVGTVRLEDTTLLQFYYQKWQLKRARAHKTKYQQQDQAVRSLWQEITAEASRLDDRFAACRDLPLLEMARPGAEAWRETRSKLNHQLDAVEHCVKAAQKARKGWHAACRKLTGAEAATLARALADDPAKLAALNEALPGVQEAAQGLCDEIAAARRTAADLTAQQEQNAAEYAACLTRQCEALWQAEQPALLQAVLDSDAALADAPELKAELQARLAAGSEEEALTLLQSKQQQTFAAALAAYVRDLSPAKQQAMQETGWQD